MIIKNLKIKFFFYDRIFPLLSVVNRLFKHKDNKILFYCNLSFRDNNKALYDYMISKGYNNRYKILVSSSDYHQYKNDAPSNVSFIGPFKAILAFFTCKYVIYCIGKIPIEPAKDQMIMHMGHGMPMKDASQGQLKYTNGRVYFSYLLSTSEVFAPIMARIYAFPKEKMIIAGNPKCEPLFEPSPNYDFGNYNKIIFWAPTFRKSVSMNMQDTAGEQKILPVVEIKDFEKLNSYLKSIGVKIVIKLHPEQDLSMYNVVDMDYFILLSHNEFLRRGMDIYRFMKQCDAMITDYSSIYYDYMLLDRPIAFTEDDMQDYAEHRGFSVDPDFFRPGMKINTTDDICTFAKNVAEGHDSYKLEREKVNNVVNEYKDGRFSERILSIMGIK